MHGLADYPASLVEAYAPLGFLHEGEGSRLFLVRPVASGDEAVLKLFHRVLGAAEQGEFLARIKTLAAVPGPHLPRVLGGGAIPEGAYLVTERVRGRAAADPQVGIGPVEALRQAAAGLRALHQAGLVHGDVRPATMLVDADRTLKLVGPNLGSEPRRLSGEPGPPRTGYPQYMAPQLFYLKRASAGDDWFAWGVSAWTLIEGRFPFEPDDMERAARIQSLPRLKSTRLEPEAPLLRAMLGCMAYTPQDRAEAIAHVEQWLAAAPEMEPAEDPPQGRRLPLPERPGRSAPDPGSARGPGRGRAGPMVALALLAAGALWMLASWMR